MGIDTDGDTDGEGARGPADPRTTPGSVPAPGDRVVVTSLGLRRPGRLVAVVEEQWVGLVDRGGNPRPGGYSDERTTMLVLLDGSGVPTRQAAECVESEATGA